MHMLDDLIQLKNWYAARLGDEKVKEIENDTNLYGDADQFRIYHAKGRFRGVTGSFLTTCLAWHFLPKNIYITGGVFVGSFTFFYQAGSRLAGFNN